LIPWVRQRIGKSIGGWQSYGAWANPVEGADAEYLVDDKKLIRTGKREDGEGISGVVGLQRVRDALRDPRKVVRLVGLSGVGKTRFVQALFDQRIGKGALDPSLALYANLSDDPDPQPVGMISDLIAGRSHAIVVVDNCPPDLHRRLSDVCRGTFSPLTFITVEYDIPGRYTRGNGGHPDRTLIHCANRKIDQTPFPPRVAGRCQDSCHALWR